MKAKLTLENGKEFEVEVDEERILKKIENKTQRTGYERVEQNSEYYTLIPNLKSTSFSEQCQDFDKKVYKSGNYFTDKELSDNIARATRLEFQLRRFSVEHRNKDIDWNADLEPNTEKYTTKFFIGYNYDSIYTVHLAPRPTTCLNTFGCIYFDTKEHCQMAIDEFKDELIWYFKEYKDCL